MDAQGMVRSVLSSGSDADTNRPPIRKPVGRLGVDGHAPLPLPYDPAIV